MYSYYYCFLDSICSCSKNKIYFLKSWFWFSNICRSKRESLS